MYVVCHKCAAAYLVEDGLIVRGDERAQCPNCMHVQAVVEPKVEVRPPTLLRALSVSVVRAVAAFRVPSIAPVAPPPAPELNGDDVQLNGAAEAPSDATCRECGARLSDAFDQALGVCEGCRTNAKHAPTPPPRVPQPIDDERTVAYSEQQLPSDVEEALGKELFENGDDIGATDSQPPVVSTPKKPNPEHVPAVQRPSLMNAAVVLPASRWHAGRLFGVMAAIAVLAIAGGALLTHRRPPKAKPPEKVHLSPRLEKTREQWARSFAGARGDPLQVLKEADLELAKDTASGYAASEKGFQRAFVLQPEGSRAVPGYLLSVAWGRGKSIDASELDQLVDLAEAAELQWGRSARILLAHASLALLGPQLPKNAERARSFAQESLGLGGGPEKALAHLVLSSAFLSSSAELAIQNADLALKLDPALRRAYLQRAAARQSLGDYRSAIADLRARLLMEPGEQSEAKECLARIYQEVGEWPLADALYRPSAGTGDLSTVVARAVIQYQSARKPQAAAQALVEGIRLHGENAPPAVLVDAWVHLATAERLSGRAEEAVKAATQALAISPSDAAAHLQLFLLALGVGSADLAQQHWKAFQGRIGDAALEKLLEGRLSMAAQREVEAMRSFAEAARLDARRLDALLLAGFAAASAGRRDDALRYLIPAGQMDPTRTAPVPIGTRFYVAPEESLAGAEGRVVRLAQGSTDVTPRLYEALIRFHQRDLRAADKLLLQVVDVDTGNALAHALRALIALDRGSLVRARAAAEHAASVGRGIAIAHYAYGRVLARSGKVEDARAEFHQAEVLAPGLLAAQLELAELEAKKASAEMARTRLIHVLRVDPSYLAAKRALYLLER